jgi:hypothetical protein
VSVCMDAVTSGKMTQDNYIQGCSQLRIYAVTVYRDTTQNLVSSFSSSSGFAKVLLRHNFFRGQGCCSVKSGRYHRLSAPRPRLPPRAGFANRWATAIPA